MTFPLRVRIAILMAACAVAIVPGAWAQSETANPPNTAKPAPETPESRIPFLQWIGAGEREEIPWRVRISGPTLRMDQRRGIKVEVRLEGKELSRSAKRELILLVRMKPSGGDWLPDFASVQHSIEEPLPSNTEIRLSANVLIRPGEYTAGVVLLDGVTQQHNVTQKTIRIERPRNDPLPDMDKNAPAVEFVNDDPETEFRPEELPRIWLPVLSRQPLRVEMLVNFGASEEPPTPQPPGIVPRGRSGRNRQAIAGPPRSQLRYATLGALLPAIKVLTQAEFVNSNVRVTGMDIESQKIVFDQDAVHDLDWAKVRDGLAARRPGTIDVHALEHRKQNAAFFRDVLAGRLSENNGTSQPLRVFVVLSNVTVFAPGADLKPVTPAGECHCRVFYFQFHPAIRASEFRYEPGMPDELGKILKPLKPITFDIYSPEDFRRALAEMTRELKKF